MISDDLLPNSNGSKANSRMSWKAVIGHEITGHREANIAGKAFELGSLQDEVQASVRASRHTPGLNNVERYQLRRDAIERIKAYDQQNNTNITRRDLRNELWLEPLNN